MKTKDVIERLGSVKALALLLHCSSAAISQWDEYVPEARLWQLKVLRPEWFIEKKETKNE